MLDGNPSLLIAKKLFNFYIVIIRRRCRNYFIIIPFIIIIILFVFICCCYCYRRKKKTLDWLGLAGWWCERGNLKKVCFAFSGFSVAIILLVV